MKNRIINILLITILSCINLNMHAMASKDSLLHTLTYIKQKYILKPKECVFDINLDLHNDTIFLKGATTETKFKAELIKQVKQIGHYYIVDQIKVLPDKELKDTLYGVINVSVANVNTQNRFTASMATQSLLGTPVKILEKENWYRIQMPDTYFGWVHSRQIVPMPKKEYNKWLIAPKVIFTKHYGFSYLRPDNDGAIVSDLVAGSVMKFSGIEGDYFKVEYPDKRIAYVLRTEAEEQSLWIKDREFTPESLTETAESMMGIPYVWGGTSTKGMDCSGLVSTVMNQHGLSILRDASQQATVGKEIDISEGYNNLKPGDLIFFGTDESIRHVGFYLGNLKFIHASGWIRVSSLDPNDEDYDKVNAEEFVKATRIIENKKLNGVVRWRNNPFYMIQ